MQRIDQTDHTPTPTQIKMVWECIPRQGWEHISALRGNLTRFGLHLETFWTVMFALTDVGAVEYNAQGYIRREAELSS